MVALIDVLFWFSSLYILPFWLMMWFAPAHERTAALLRNEWVYLAPLAAAYTLAVLPNLVDILVLLGSDMPTPEIVVSLFDDREVILIGWLHYLAFDLFVGRWTWQRLMATNQPIYVSFPVLLFSMMVAPLGALLGLVVTKDIGTTTTSPAAD
ncbi:MAG: ABA4-like family protein [archaeon]|nr:ABA4-like family protein [archaeon]